MKYEIVWLYDAYCFFLVCWYMNATPSQQFTAKCIPFIVLSVYAMGSWIRSVQTEVSTSRWMEQVTNTLKNNEKKKRKEKTPLNKKEKKEADGAAEGGNPRIPGTSPRIGLLFPSSIYSLASIAIKCVLLPYCSGLCTARSIYHKDCRRTSS